MAKGRPRPPRLELSSCRELNCKSSTTTYARTCRPSSAKRTYMRPFKLSVYLEEYIYCLPPIYKLPCAPNEFGLHQDGDTLANRTSGGAASARAEDNMVGIVSVH